MRITKALLSEYAKVDAELKKLSDKKEEIRAALIADGRQTIEMDGVVVSIDEYTQERFIPMKEAIEVLGEKTCRRITKVVTAHRVSVRRVS
jgi:hypothetical protein